MGEPAQYEISLYQMRNVLVVKKDSKIAARMTIRQAAIALDNHDALVEALEQACLELEEAANLLQSTTLKGSASLMRLAAEKHHALLAAAKKE